MRIQHEIGYTALFNPTYMLFQWDQDMADLSSAGFKLRTTIKWPLKTEGPTKNLKYIGLDFMYKYLTWTQKNVEIWRMQAFWELMDFTSYKHVGAVHFVFGIQSFLNPINNIINDTYFGVGMRYKHITDDIPEDVSEDVLTFYDQFQGAMISIMAGFKFGFGVN
jgi:hypothetical protein